MEGRKNRYSLPSNYVTLAQLQERWLKQQTQINHHPQPPSPPRPQKQYLVKNPNDSDTHRPSIVAADDHCKSEAVARIGDETADPESKTNESKKQKNRRWNRKSKTRERKASEEKGSARAKPGGKEAEKTVIECELKEKKNGGSGSAAKEEDAGEQRVRISSIKLKEENNNNNNSVDSVRTEKVEQKTGASVTMEKVEQRVRVLSIKSENNKQQNGKLRKTNNRFYSQKKYYGEAGYGYGNRYGPHYEAREQKTEKMVWVKKDG